MPSRPKISARVDQGDAFDLLARLEPASIDLILTSPPYWGLRAYGLEHNSEILAAWTRKNEANDIPSYAWYRKNGGVLGLEPLPEWYIAHLAEIFARGAHALKPGGSLWINIGDTYFARWSSIRENGRQGLGGEARARRRTPMGGYRQEKQLLLIPARLAVALQEQRWILRNDLIWFKPNIPPRPETDRLRLSHEHFFHFVKRRTQGRPKYYYQLAAVEPGAHDVVTQSVRAGRDGHSATFPTELIRPRIESCCPPGGWILDPFAGTGRALEEAVRLGRNGLGFELSPKFYRAAKKKLSEL